MSSLKDKLKGIINSPLDNTSNYQNKNYNNERRQNNKLLYTQINGNNQTRSEILSQVKNKIREFKHNRENYNDDLLNFEVSREALQKYYPSHQNGENDIKEKLNNSMNMIKTGNFNTNNNNDMITFANPNMKFDDNYSKNNKSFIINNNNNNYNSYNKDENDNFNDRNIKPLKRYFSSNKKHLTVNERNNIYNFDKIIKDEEIDKDNTMNMFPCEKEHIKKESLILEIESELLKLQREKNKLNDDLNKLPEFPKKKIEINQRRELELKIERYEKNINDQKTKLRELNKNK